ncbi:creatininase [Corynebacterium sp. sy017]|uniref:creatininase n=1 Tax=unclassified Corynebacterium TaxID=2624378 RepID=UPI001184F1C3|nr:MULTISPECIES: creatininase [unclassified Corynebacterium]MBP3089409.1 creatininase [Corynebacterium sp. sy017]TSD90904.1 creatininase [Corynebacterium sp. SY003]
MYAAAATWEDIAAATDSIAIVPVGSCEQHGRHLPLSTDTIIAQHIAAGVEKLIDAVVFPEIHYGYRSNPFSGGGPLFPGTIDLSAMALISLATDILTEILADGFSKVLIINSHFENQFPLQEAMICAQQQAGRDVKIMQTNWWDPLPEHILNQLFDQGTFPGWALEHGALTETSLMLHIAPDVVRQQNYPQEVSFSPPTYLRVPSQKTDIPSHGALASAAGASAAKGKIIAQAAIAGIVDMCALEFPLRKR